MFRTFCCKIMPFHGTAQFLKHLHLIKQKKLYLEIRKTLHDEVRSKTKHKQNYNWTVIDESYKHYITFQVAEFNWFRQIKKNFKNTYVI